MLKVLFPWKQNNTKKVPSAMEQAVEEAGPSTDELPPDELPLLPCHVCNRTFLPKPLKKHIPICEQTARKKRKPFDSLKQRVEGTDMASFYQKSYLKKSNPETSSQAQAADVYGSKQSKWREKHFELQKTIKHAKGSKTDMNPNPPSNITSITPNRKAGHLSVNHNSTNERCPVCDRSFGPKAFDRHVEFCKEQKNRVQVHKSPAVVQQAKERLEARINYRVPPLRQSKRSLVRDKYSPSSQTSLLHRSNSIVSGKSTTSLSSSVTAMLPNRRPTMKNSEKNSELNNKKEVTSKSRLDKIRGDCGDVKESTKNESNSIKNPAITTNNINYDPFEKAHLQLMELIEYDNNSITSSTTLHCDMSAMSTPTIELYPFVTSSSTPKLKPETIHERSIEKRVPLIDPPYHFQDDRASKDVEKEFELLESLMNNNFDEASDRALSDSDKRALIPSKYFPEEVEVIDPILINAHDNLVIPENLLSYEHSSNFNEEYHPIVKTLDNTNQTAKRYSRLNRRPTRLEIKPTTQPLPFILPDQVRLAPDGSSAVSPTRKTTPKSYQTSKVKSKMKIDFSPESQKSINNRTFGTSNLGKQTELESRKGLAEEIETVALKQETSSFDRTPTAEELYPDNPMMYEEFRKYEEMYRREKKRK